MSNIVKSCRNIEGGVRFTIDGVKCCCANTWESPVVITAEEMRNGVTYDLVVQRRRELFDTINGFNDKDAGACVGCSRLCETTLDQVNFEYLGAVDMQSGFNIAHFTMCNMKCTYCIHFIENLFMPPQYENIIQFIEEFKVRDKIRPEHIWIEYNGGEPTLLNNFEEILNYLIDNNIGQICLFSNALKYSNAIYKGLKENKIFLTTSIDAGTKETFKEIRGIDTYEKVKDNLAKYQSSGTNNLWLKYIICSNNQDETNLNGFVQDVLKINPNKVYICPDFPYGDREIPYESAVFGAKMWYLITESSNIEIYIQTDDMKANPKFAVFSKNIREEYLKLRQSEV